MVTGDPVSGLKVIEIVCDAVAILAIPKNVFQFDVPWGPVGVYGKNNSDGALAVGTALVKPISAPPGNCVVSEALTATLELIETRSMLSSGLRSPNRKEDAWNPVKLTDRVVNTEPFAAFSVSWTVAACEPGLTR